MRAVEAAARAIGLQIQILNAGTIREINAAFATFVRERPDALLVGIDPFFNGRRVQLVNLAARHSLPASYPARDFAEAGRLMSYGADIADAWRQVGSYAGRILKGDAPADLPVVQSSKFELVINAQTATMLDLTMLATSEAACWLDCWPNVQAGCNPRKRNSASRHKFQKSGPCRNPDDRDADRGDIAAPIQVVISCDNCRAPLGRLPDDRGIRTARN